MDKSEYQRLSRRMWEIDLKDFKKELDPYLEAGDLDARYLNTLFSVDPSETEVEFYRRSAAETIELANLFQPDAMHAVASMYLFGENGLKVDIAKFRAYIAAAALLGQPKSIRTLAQQVERDLGWDGFLERVQDLEDLE